MTAGQNTVRRAITLLLSLSLLLGAAMLPVSAAGLGNFKKVKTYTKSTYSDIRTTDWYYDNVKSAFELNLMNGKGAGKFDWQSGVTVAETLAIASRLHSIYHTGSGDFEASSPWYQVYVDYAKKNAIATVTEQNVNEAATRSMFAQILAKALPDDALSAINEVADDAIPDVSVKDACGPAVYKLYRAGILTGSDNKGSFQPGSNIRRCEVASIITRMADPSLRKTVTLKKAVQQPVQQPTQKPAAQSIAKSNYGSLVYSSFETKDTDTRERWASIIGSYLIPNADGTLTAVSAGTDVHGKNAVSVEIYNADSTLKSRSTLDFELSLFGGFYAGASYNYFVFAQENPGESDSTEVLRLVRYDKAFNRVDSCAISGINTAVPFTSGTLRMTEKGNTVVIYTARQRYRTEDGIQHQSNLAVYVDMDAKKVTNSMKTYPAYHVSHSFNQFALNDGGKIVLVDHGDAFPRCVQLQREVKGPDQFDKVDLFTIPGESGMNCTGVTVGGLAMSSGKYLVSISTVDQSKITAYDNYAPYGLGRDERNVVILSVSRSDLSAGSVKQVYLTDYVGKKLTASTPYLVPLGGDKFAVLWEQYNYASGGNATSDGVCCRMIDGSGAPLGEMKLFKGVKLSTGCQPVVSGGNIVWYTDKKASGSSNAASRTFYRLPVSALGA